MFEYYRLSHICYVYLDVEVPDSALVTARHLDQARWTTRGWTLQEIIAPENVEFYTKSWRFCGTRKSIAVDLNEVTGIDTKLLNRTSKMEPLQLERYSVAQRMSWAANRNTTRPEDIAYCLLGLFDVHMPLLYGEGQYKAFLRLQEEIMKHSMDHSILAWSAGSGIPRAESKGYGVLAPSPALFRDSADVVTFWGNEEPFEMTNKGLRVRIPIIDSRTLGPAIAVLNCRNRSGVGEALGLRLVHLDDIAAEDSTREVYYRQAEIEELESWEIFNSLSIRTLYLARSTRTPWETRERSDNVVFWFRFRSIDGTDGNRSFHLSQPSIGTWDDSARVLRLSPEEADFPTFSLWLFERAKTIGRPSINLGRFVVERNNVFWCTKRKIFPSYKCSLTDDMNPNSEWISMLNSETPHYYFNLRVHTSGPPNVIMDEYVYEFNIDLLITAWKDDDSEVQSYA